MLTLSITIAALLATTHAANDWSIPCTNGSCSYDIAGNDNTSMPASMSLNGPNHLLSDITPAAGWQILDCNPNWSNGSQNIRIVCTGTPAQMANCSHLDNGGAANTVVRLPENCGTGPFAHVNSTFTPTNLSTPFNLSGVQSRSPTVRGLVLDYNFESIPPSRGTLNLSVASTNTGAPVQVQKRSRSRLHVPRAAVKASSAAVKASSAAVKASPSTVSSALAVKSSASSSVSSALAVKSSASSSVSSALALTSSASSSVSSALAVESSVSSTVSSTAPATSASQSESSTTIPIKLNQQAFPLVDTQIKCSSLQSDTSGTAVVKIIVDANIDAAVEYGYTFSGSVVPLKINTFSMSATLTGEAVATFNFQTQAQGSYDTGPLALFKSGLPGLTIPGIITLGPSFSINGVSAMAGVEFGTVATMTADAKFPNLQFKFPQTKTPESVVPQINQNSFQLSASNPSVDFTGQLSGHIIPRVDFGVMLGSGNAISASFFMDIDMSAVATLQFRAGAAAAQASAVAAVSPASSATAAAVVASSASAASVAPTAAVSPASSAASAAVVSSSASTVPVAPKAASAAPAASPASSVASATVARRDIPLNGCVNVSVGVSVNAGVSGTIPGIVNQDQTFPLAATTQPLFSKCAGAGFSGAPANASVAPASPSARGISGGSTIARAVRYGVGKRAGAAPVSISSPKATAPIEVSPPRPAAPSVASVTATGLISQSTNPAINLIKSQTSTSSTTKLDCTNLRALSSVIKVF